MQTDLFADTIENAPVEPVRADLAQAQKFLELISAREKEFEQGWWKGAEEAEEIYATDDQSKMKDVPYNILYSNTEVLLPSLYSATPKPDVRPRHKGQNLGQIPDVVSRFLSAASDPASPGADTLDSAMADSTLSALLPGMGYVRVKLDPERAFPFSYESGHYKTFIWGKASRWSKVPWVAFKHPMKREQMQAQFNINLAELQANFTPTSEADDERDNCCVYEFWNKLDRKVYYLCEEWSQKLLQPPAEDPMGLTGFFPTPGPLLLTARPGKLLPKALYSFYKNQANELNRVTARLNKVLAAIRVRGAYNGMLGDDLKNLLSDTEDNTLIAAQEAALLAQSGGFDKHIWMLPIESFIKVAAELYKAREAIKQVIYEITGISDIIRGSSVASETATAQDLKNKWGTVRLRRMQKIVADYARDLFRLTVDCAADHIPAEKWQSITQLQFPTPEEKAQAQQQVQMLALQQIPGQPPALPDPKLVATLQSPTMEDILGKIAADLNRAFVVNIQTSSTVDLDSAQDKNEVSEFMNAMGQLMPGLQVLMSLGPTGLEAVKAILVGVCERFKFSIDIADVMKRLTLPPPPPPEQKGPPPPTPEEVEALKAESQFKLQKVQADTRVLEAETALKLQEIESAKQKLSIDIELAGIKLQTARVTARAAQTKAATPAPQGKQSATVSS